MKLTSPCFSNINSICFSTDRRKSTRRSLRRPELNTIPFGFRGTLTQRIAMIRKWQRNEASAGEPASNVTKHPAIFQFAFGTASTISDRQVLVRLLKGLQPRSGMKDRRARMLVQQVVPTPIGEDQVQRQAAFELHCRICRLHTGCFESAAQDHYALKKSRMPV